MLQEPVAPCGAAHALRTQPLLVKAAAAVVVVIVEVAAGETSAAAAGDASPASSASTAGGRPLKGRAGGEHCLISDLYPTRMSSHVSSTSMFDRIR